MSSLSQFSGGGATKAIVNAFSAGGVISTIVIQGGQSKNAADVVTSVGTTAAALVELLSVTGGGDVPYLSAYVTDTTPRTIRAKVTVDGIVVFDATSSASSLANTGLLVIGVSTSTGLFTQAPAPLRFNSSLLVEVASSLTEAAGKIGVAYALNKR